ncbi:MAG: Cof-type HAD-IIB family hydrolase [Clostridia bacterium]|nr:Cof-type HAD-IIB family hydrolase [Clostridia bacterium]
MIKKEDGPIKLYLSDLDGTLLNNNTAISDYTKKTLKKLIDDGLCFSVATARTAATVSDFFEGIAISAGVLMNGTVVFDFQKEEYLVVHKILENALSDILEILDKYPVSPFIYSVCGKYLNVYHKKLTKEYELSFYEPRKNRRLKKFFEISSFDEIPNKDEIIYSCLLTDKETAENIKAEINRLEGISAICYKDNLGDFYYVEIMSQKASKASGALWLKNYYNAETLIAFGDNLNDIPLLEVADKKIAVENAVEPLKDISDIIIESNHNDGVIKFIEKDI